MKSNKNNRKAQFGRIGVVSLMALSLSSQSVFALDLWYVTGPKKDTKLESLLDSDKTEAVDWLSRFEASKFIEKFGSQPIQFVEALQESFKKNSSVADFKDKLKDAFKALEASKFGGDKQKEAVLRIVERANKAEINSDEFLELALASEKDRQALNVTLVKPQKKEDGNVGEQTSEDDFKALCESLKKQQADQIAAIEKTQKELLGKVNKDNEAKLLAQQARLDEQEKRILEAEARASAAQEQANQFDPAALARKEQEKDASDVLNGLLGSLVQDQNARNAEEEVAPAQNNQQPFFPQQARVSPNNLNNFNQPLPTANNLPFFPQQNSSGIQVPVTYDLGVSGGRPELADAQEIISSNDMRQSVASSISPMATIQDLVVAKARVSSDVKRTQVALQNAKDKASQLDEKLEELKEGGRAALSPSVKQRLAQLKQAVDTKTNYLNQQRQMLQMLSPDQRDQLNNTLMQAQMDLNNAEQQYNQYNAQVETVIEQANGQIKALAKQRDQLNSASSKLQSQMSSLKEDETAVTQLINNQMQSQMQMMNAGAGVPNINRIQNRGGSRSPVRGALSGANGNYVRPALAK
ncbi:MAG: hypothetical protein ACKN9V_00445 [Pseudomonadota bacterium]